MGDDKFPNIILISGKLERNSAFMCFLHIFSRSIFVPGFLLVLVLGFGTSFDGFVCESYDLCRHLPQASLANLSDRDRAVQKAGGAGPAGESLKHNAASRHDIYVMIENRRCTSSPYSADLCKCSIGRCARWPDLPSWDTCASPFFGWFSHIFQLQTSISLGDFEYFPMKNEWTMAKAAKIHGLDRILPNIWQTTPKFNGFSLEQVPHL